MSDELPPVPSPVSPRIRNVGLAVIVGLGLLIVLVAILLPAPTHANAREKVRAFQCVSNVRQIGLACAMYADYNGGRLPQTLDSLTNRFCSSTRIFFCPSVKDQTHYSYALTGVTNKWNDGSNVIVLREIEANHHGKRTFLYDDGHVEQRKD